MGVTRLGYSKMAKAITIIWPLCSFHFFSTRSSGGLTRRSYGQVVAVAFMLTDLMLAEVFLSYYVLSDEGIERHRFYQSIHSWNESNL